MGVRRANCEVHRHEATINFVQRGLTGGNTVTYFQDLTENHYKALVDVRILSASTGSTQVVITPRVGDDITINIPIFSTAVADIFGQIVLQVEDARAISISYSGTLVPTVTGSINIVKDFCICCP